MDKHIKKHLDDTIDIVDQAQKALEDEDEYLVPGHYYCGLCGFVPLGTPCVHHLGDRS